MITERCIVWNSWFDLHRSHKKWTGTTHQTSFFHVKQCLVRSTACFISSHKSSSALPTPFIHFHSFFSHFFQTNNPLGQSIHIRRDFLFAQFAERQIHSHHGYRAVFLCQFLHHTPFLRFPTESPCTQPFNASSTMLISSSSVTALHSIPFHSYNHRSPSPRSFLRSKNVETELSSRSGCESRSHTRCIRGTRQREMYGRDEDLWTRKKSTKEGKKNVHTADQQTNTVRTTFVCESTEMLF